MPQGISEGMDIMSAARELCGENRGAILSVDASACKGMLRCTAAWKVKHISTKQLWVQGAMQGYGAEMHKVPNTLRIF